MFPGVLPGGVQFGVFLFRFRALLTEHGKFHLIRRLGIRSGLLGPGFELAELRVQFVQPGLEIFHECMLAVHVRAPWLKVIA